jgi:hypothetical protein
MNYNDDIKYGVNYRGKSASEITRSRSPKQTSEEIAAQIEVFGESNIKRYDNLNQEIIS